MSYKEIKSFIEDFSNAHEMVAEFQA